MEASSARTIVLLGKTGAGKSSIANTIFGEKTFQTNDTPVSQTSVCKSETRVVNGRNITLIDTPGFFDTTMSEEELRRGMVRCMTKCAPGPHAFLIVLKVEKFTKQEEEIITKIKGFFSPEAFRYATVLFTFGDQLPDDTTIQDFVNQSEALKDLVSECGGGCHVIDNKYWNNNPQNNYRSNQFQVAELLNTIDKMVEDNGLYSNELLQYMEMEIQKEISRSRGVSGNMSDAEIREQATERVYNEHLIRFADVPTGALLRVFLGLVSLGVLGVALYEAKHLVPMVQRIVKRTGSVAAGSVAVVVDAVAGIVGPEQGMATGIGIAAGVICGAGAVTGNIEG